MRKTYYLFFPLWLGFAAHALLAVPPALETFRQKAEHGPIDRKAITEMRQELARFLDEHGRVTPELQQGLFLAENEFFVKFTDDTKAAYQSWMAEIGAKMQNPIRMPENETSFWLLQSDQYAGFRSSPQLPQYADFVVIGAGLTGSSALYHLTHDPRSRGKTILLLEADRPAAQASGRNGGNFELIQESYTGSGYEGLIAERLKWLRQKYPNATAVDLSRMAEKHVQLLVDFNYQNFMRLTNLIENEKIDCDYSPAGWLKIASSDTEENALGADLPLLSNLGPRIEEWSPLDIRERFNLPAYYKGMFITKSGNYHPYKFITGVLGKSLAKGALLYTGIRVKHVLPNRDTGAVTIETSDGTITAGKVIVATNAFTTQIFPELTEIQYHVSQVVNLEHVQESLQGAIVTERNGDIYFNFPASKRYVDSSGRRRGMLHFGLDWLDQVKSLEEVQKSEAHFHDMLSLIQARFPDTKGQPPSRMWAATMAFTPDRIPLIGFMYGRTPDLGPLKNIIIAAAFQGYGGSYTIQAGYVASHMAITASPHPSAPEELFAPVRFAKP